VQDDDGSWRPIKQHDVARGLLTCKKVCAMLGGIDASTLYQCRALSGTDQDRAEYLALAFERMQRRQNHA